MFEIEESGAASSFELEETYTPSAVIKVLGVGGAGGNAVNRMIEAGVRGVEFIAMNTDMQVLAKNLAPVKLQLGAKLTGGKGVGADPEKGRQAALESEAEILELIKGADMIFVAAGMGKGTGTGAAPVVAEISRRLGILTIPVVTRPFKFEGAACQRRAEQGLQALSKVTDSTLVIHNDKIMAVAGRVPLTDALRQADDTLRHAIQSISDVVTSEGLMNCDFNDVRAIMNERGG
ncbi:MAG: cell division protein FtsZ, partial [candidate division FCPU426 bacterium]